MDELQKKLDELKEQLEKAATEKAKAEIALQIKALEDKLKEAQDGVTNDITEIKESVKVLKDAADKNQEWIDKQIAEGNTVSTKGQKQEKSFNDILGEAIEKNAETLQNMAPGQYSKSNPLRIDLMPEVKAEGNKPREVKTVGDMSISANFTGGSTFVQDVRQNLITTPYNRVWIADLLPQGTTTGQTVLYPKENGGEGGAAAWTDPTANKAQIDFDLTTQTAYVKWIAGYVIIAREMLDDISWMTSYIQQKMLISLKTAENNAVLNGIGGTNPMVGLIASATAYGPSSYTADVDKIVDAAYGQIVEDTDQFYQGNLAIVKPREAVRIGLNKATGSGEYDLPNGTVAFIGGNLTVAGVRVAPTTAIGEGDALVLDTNATQFIRRMQPELRVFEDSDLAKLNKIMFRIEERVTLAVFNNSAIVALDVSSS